MYCPECEMHGKDGNYCNQCGTKTVFSKFPCPFCKAPNFVSAKFCEHCAKPIQEAGMMFIKGIEKGGEKR